MAKLPFVFDASEEIEDPFAVVPEGWYTATIVDSKMKDNKAKNGKYLELSFKINGGKYDGRKIIERLNLINPNQTAVSIAKLSLQQITKALDLAEVEDSAELHGIPMKIKLKVNPATESFGESNGIAAYASMDDEVDDSEDDNPF